MSGVTTCNAYSKKQHSDRTSMKGVYLLVASIAVLAISTGSDAAPDPKPGIWLPIQNTAKYHRVHKAPTVTSAATAGSVSAPSPTPTSDAVGR